MASPGPSVKAAAPAAAAPQLQLIPASAEGALDAAEEAVDLLLDSGRAPGEVLVITTGDLHPWAAHELSFGEAAYWAQHEAGDDVFYADASAVGRAASRPVVVVAVNGGSIEAVASGLPLALGRAGALLIVCGDPQQINSVLGAGSDRVPDLVRNATRGTSKVPPRWYLPSGHFALPAHRTPFPRVRCAGLTCVARGGMHMPPLFGDPGCSVAITGQTCESAWVR